VRTKLLTSIIIIALFFALGYGINFAIYHFVKWAAT
jgi:hypothetical protein